MPEFPPSKRPGLQAQRTDFSWARTALAFAVNGFLLLTRYRMPGNASLHTAAAGLAGLLLVFALIMLRRRRRALAQFPLPVPLADPVAINLLACGTLLLAASVVGILLL